VADQLLLLVVGFALTTVVGGVLGYGLQRRAWGKQEEARLAEREVEAARAFYEELSRLLDRRIYRMRQLDWALAGSVRAEDCERKLARYQEAMDDWNDNINRMLALAQRYFGDERRHYLDYDLGRRVRGCHDRLQDRIDAYRAGGKLLPSLGDELKALAGAVYTLNVQMIEQIQRGDVGLLMTEDSK
jgi:hypothetical protein